MLGKNLGLVGFLSTVAGALITFLGLRWRRPQFNAEARKSNAQASHQEWGTLRDEIARLDVRTAELRREIDTIKTNSRNRVKALDRENSRLRSHITRLERRVGELESIFKIGPVPPEMQAELDKLDKIKKLNT